MDANGDASILDTSTNDLTGGLVVRAVANFADDDRTKTTTVKSAFVAIAANTMESTAAVAASILHWKIPRRRWRRHRCRVLGNRFDLQCRRSVRPFSPGSNPSNAEATRLVHARYMTGNSCDTDTPDAGLTLYGAYICRILFYSNEFVSVSSISKHGAAWRLAIRFPWNSGAAQAISTTRLNPFHGTSSRQSSAAPGRGQPVWDPQVRSKSPILPTPKSSSAAAYTFSVLFESDSSVASEGFHIDDFVHFGVTESPITPLTFNATTRSTDIRWHPTKWLRSTAR